MGLLGSNPYASDNPIAAAINGLLSGYNTAEDRFMAKKKQEEELARHSAMLAMQKQQQEVQDELARANLSEHAQKQKALQDAERYKVEFAKRMAVDTGSIGSQFLGDGKTPNQVFQDMQAAAQPKPLSPYEQATYLSQGIPKEAIDVFNPKEKPLNPIIKQLLDAEEKGTITPTGKGILEKAGYGGMFQKAPDKPEYKSEESYDKNTHLTTSRDFYWKDGDKVYVGKPRVTKGRESTQISLNTGDRADLYEKKAAFGELPKLRQDAQSAVVVGPKLERMKTILESGNAGSTVSYLQNMLAPYAPEAKGANEAQLFQILARTVAGPQRVNIIGPGPQTEKEGELLFKVGGGGNQGRLALRELLQFHVDANKSKVNEYNQMLESAGTKIYKPLSYGVGDKQPTDALKVGDVKKGFVYLGGDPANRKSWGKK